MEGIELLECNGHLTFRIEVLNYTLLGLQIPFFLSSIFFFKLCSVQEIRNQFYFILTVPELAASINTPYIIPRVSQCWLYFGTVVLIKVPLLPAALILYLLYKVIVKWMHKIKLLYVLNWTSHCCTSCTNYNHTTIWYDIWYDMIYFVNRSWVDNLWQQYSTHLHTNSTQYNTMKQNTQNRIYVTIRIHKHNNKST